MWVSFSLLKRSCIFPGVLGQILTTSNDRLSNISVICRPGHADTCQHCPISWLTTSCVFVFALAVVFVYLVADTCQTCRISWLTSACIFVRSTRVKSAKEPIESNNAQTSKAPTPASSKNCAKGQELHWSMTGGLSHMCSKAKPDSNWWPSLWLMQSQMIGNPSKWLKLLFCWMP